MTTDTPIPVQYRISFTSTVAVDDFISPLVWQACRDLAIALKDFGVEANVILDTDQGEHEKFDGRALCEG